MDVCGLFVPFKVDRFLNLQRVPSLSPLANLAVGVEIDLRLDDGVFKMLDFFLRRP